MASLASGVCAFVSVGVTGMLTILRVHVTFVIVTAAWVRTIIIAA